ncbi:hypothetical protein HK439_01085 [Labrenzia aggregata]|uniref:ISXO2-like transposase domain-containing protein n=1 Tax=Roseibium aggregatum TaxID=187304 RepID=A0A926P108_9HYPH|nr:hypothetical protein [Roseibium aggregatum]
MTRSRTARRRTFAGNLHFNTVEGIAALLKRTQLGVYHQLSKRHLQR